MVWSVELAEQPMSLGAIDNLLFGKDATHSFLILRDDQGRVASEIHGTTFHPGQQKLGYGGQSIATALAAVVSSMRLDPIFKFLVGKSIFNNSFPRLKAVVTDGEWRTSKAQHKTIVLKGSKKDVISEWLDACKMGRLFNKQNVFYIPITLKKSGLNCNTLTSLMLHAMNIDCSKVKFNLAAVGFSNKLHERMKAIKKFDRYGKYNDGELDQLLTQEIKCADGYYAKHGPGVNTSPQTTHNKQTKVKPYRP